MQLPTAAQFFSKEDPTKPDINFLKNHFYREGRLSDDHALYILEKATDILKQESNLISVDAPVTGKSRCLDGSMYTFDTVLPWLQFAVIFTANT
jgi:hypothetical protein